MAFDALRREQRLPCPSLPTLAFHVVGAMLFAAISNF